MGYKILGYIVWQRWKRSLRVGARSAVRKAAVAAFASLLVGAAIAATQRQVGTKRVH
jgi:hypothetical protein